MNMIAFPITHAGDLAMHVDADATSAKGLWDEYTHAAPVIQRICQMRSQAMREGDQSGFQNVIYTYAPLLLGAAADSERVIWVTRSALGTLTLP